MFAPHSSERGSALIYIFIGVVLFGILMFIFARGGQENTSVLNQQGQNISAAAIIDESRMLDQAVQKLLSNGCSESELSFDHAPYTANTNPAAPIDKHCHIFHPDGAKLNAAAFNPHWVFSSLSAFPNAGTVAPELAAYVDGVDKVTCQKINDLLKNGLTTPPTTTGAFFTATFDGTFTGTPINLVAATNITAGCTYSSTATSYVFFKTLIIR